MKKTVVMLMLVFALSGCGLKPNQPGTQPNGQSANVVQNETPTPKDYTVANPSDMPSEAASWLASAGTSAGAYTYQHPDFTFIKIVPPAGVGGVKIVEFVKGDYEKKVVIDYDKSLKSAPLYIKVASESISSYTVVTSKGALLDVKDKTILASFEQPKANQKIDSPVRVKGKIAVFEGAFIIRILDASGKILKEERGQTSGAPVWGSFDMQVSYPKPTTKNGSIELGEYSAKDGAYVRHARVEVSY